jgi:hypothetical protein
MTKARKARVKVSEEILTGIRMGTQTIDELVELGLPLLKEIASVSEKSIRYMELLILLP